MAELKNVIARYQELRLDILAFNFVSYLINWDSDTEAKAGSLEDRSIFVGRLNEMELRITRSKEYIDIVNTLFDNRDNLDELLRIEITNVHKEMEKNLKIPEQEMINHSMLMAKSPSIWAAAKLNNDYNAFKDTLKELMNFNKRFIKYLETDELKGYDILLDNFEEGMTKEKYDQFFDLLKKEIVPLVKKINEKNKDYQTPKFATLDYPIEKQKEFASYLMDVMCFDQNYGLMKESEHPFTSGFGTHDVRVTNHYYVDNFVSSIFSAIHELGHATYERANDEKLNFTFLQGGTTMAMHESQSRFYENIVGRSYPFWQRHYPKLQEVFKEQLKDVTLDEFYRFINHVTPSLIRTEADELTYSLHIMVRYEMEKIMVETDTPVEEYPKIWNKLYYDYLGVEVPNDREGILQDIHWAFGECGYFPTYALGSAYGAQLLNQMKKDLDINQAFGSDNLSMVNEWLKKHIHQYGKMKKPNELLIDTTGESFNPEYFVKYLKEKYSRIYKL